MCQFEDLVFNSIKAIVAFECLSQQRVPQSTTSATVNNESLSQQTILDLYSLICLIWFKIKQCADLKIRYS